jgi:hypothetical protein
MTFSEWINKTSMQSLRSLAIIIVFGIVCLGLLATSMYMFLNNDAARAFNTAVQMVQNDTTKAVLEAAAAVRAGAQTTETSDRNNALALANALITLIGIAIGANVAGQAVDRYSSREHGESKAKIEEAKAKGQEAARIAANGSLTKERSAVVIPQPEQVDINVETGDAGVRSGK